MSTTRQLLTIDAVLAHLHERRDELAGCVLGFSGGKEASLLRMLTREVLGQEPPMVYASCPSVEWPEHLEFVRDRGAEIIATKHDRAWWERNAKWAFLAVDSQSANRFARQHQRGIIRKVARDRGKVLLWGNRRGDGNWAPEHRYRATDGTELWLPLADLPTAELSWIPTGELSPMYGYRSCVKSGYPSGRIRCDADVRLRDAQEYLDGDTRVWFERVYAEKFHAAF